MAEKQPLRQCLGCREHKQKKEFVRFVKSPDGEISLDLSGKKPGRGAYVCNNNNCINKIIKSNALARVFKTRIPENLLFELGENLNES